MRQSVLLMGLILAVVVSSGCIGSVTESSSQNLSASEWCQQNDHGEAVSDGCVEQTEAIGMASQGGEFYYSGDYEQIGCPEGQLYICEE